jgi:D-glycero-alpha-D-manno-heptose 1-phosphate guanylyltransferase
MTAPGLGGAAVAGASTLVLCGGLGTRLRSAVSDRPKPMAPVRGRPFLEWLLRFLHRAGTEDVVLATGHMGEVVEDHFGDGSALGVRLLYSREDRPLGTAGAVRAALPMLPGRRLLVLNGDSFCDVDMAALLATHAASGADATVLVVPASGDRYGAVLLADDGRVVEFAEKRALGQGLVNAGVYVMERAVIAALPEGRELSLEREVLPEACRRGSLQGMLVAGPLLDIGTPESYALAERLLPNDAGVLGG